MKYILFFVLLSTSSIAQNKKVIRYNLPEGSSYTIHKKIYKVIDGVSVMNTFFDVQLNVDKHQDNVNTLIMYLTNFRVKMSKGIMTVSYDSNKKESSMSPFANDIHFKLLPLLNTKVVMQVGVQGSFENVNTVGAGFDATYITDEYDEIIFPIKSVSEGDSWLQIRQKRGKKVRYKYTVIAITNDVIKLSVSGKTSQLVNGVLRGFIEIDKKTGFPLLTEFIEEYTVMGKNVAVTTISQLDTKVLN